MNMRNVPRLNGKKAMVNMLQRNTIIKVGYWVN